MEKYIPDIYQENIFKINFDKLKEKGIKTILLDLDNTILTYKETEPKEKVKKLIKELKEKNFDLIIYSNGSKKRVDSIKEILDIDGFYRAKKPLKSGFVSLINKYKLNIDEVAIIGDQMMTDVLGGNRVGITTILVNQLDKKEPIWTKFNRYFENRKMNKLRKKSLFTKGRFYE